MYYRRKVILSLLEMFEGKLEKVRLQKLLFLFCERKEKPEYEFIPYKYGCFSYSASADLVAMTRKEVLSESGNFLMKKDSRNFTKTLKNNDKDILTDVVRSYGRMSSSVLIKHTYMNFPYYAINSEIKENILDDKYLERIKDAIPKTNETTLFTIGYEGVSLEHYLNKLVKNDVKVLVDVRKNPLSMKFGFSKTLLKRYCESLNINYVHQPEVGIKSNKRQELNTQEDYDKLFVEYKHSTLEETQETQENILSLLKKNKRIALTCFEANVCQCHRKPLAESISRDKKFEFSVKHI